MPSHEAYAIWDYQNRTACNCAAGDWQPRMMAAIQECRATGRIPKVINIGRDVWEHIECEWYEGQRYLSDRPSSFRGVRLNYDPDFEPGLIEVK